MKNIQKIRQAGVDLAQNVIQIYAADQEGRKVMSRRFSRAKALEVLEQMSPSMIGIETCSGAHSWGRILMSMSDEVKDQLIKQRTVCDLWPDCASCPPDGNAASSPAACLIG